MTLDLNKIDWSATSAAFSALVAAGVLCWTVIWSVYEAKRQRRQRLADRLQAKVDRIRLAASSYVGWISNYCDYKQHGESGEQFDNVQRNMMSSVNELVLLVEENDYTRISDWHAEVVSHADAGEFDEAGQKIAMFADMISDALKKYNNQIDRYLGVGS